MIDFGRPAEPWPTRAASRWFVEGAVAVVFLAFALETLAHRHFSPDPYYQAAMLLLALGTATLGLLPLLFHISRRLLVVGLALLVAMVLGLLLIGGLKRVLGAKPREVAVMQRPDATLETRLAPLANG